MPSKTSSTYSLVLIITGLLFAGWWGAWRSREAVPVVTAPEVKQEAVQKAEAVARPAAPVASQSKPRQGIMALPQEVPLTSIPDRYEGMEVIALRETPPPHQPRTRWTVIKLVNDAKGKYPLVRVEERWTINTQGPVRTRQSAMIADHVLVKLRPQQRIEVLLKRFDHLHPAVRKHLPSSNVWVISFEDADLDTVPRAVQEMRRAVDIVAVVEPDFALGTSNVLTEKQKMAARDAVTER